MPLRSVTALEALAPSACLGRPPEGVGVSARRRACGWLPTWRGAVGSGSPRRTMAALGGSRTVREVCACKFLFFAPAVASPDRVYVAAQHPTVNINENTSAAILDGDRCPRKPFDRPCEIGAPARVQCNTKAAKTSRQQVKYKPEQGGMEPATPRCRKPASGAAARWRPAGARGPPPPLLMLAEAC